MSRRHHAKALMPYILLIIAAILLCLTVALALSGSLRSGKSDQARYADISAECNRRYYDEMAKGVRFAVYPCEDSMLREEFNRLYGYQYAQ